MVAEETAQERFNSDLKKFRAMGGTVDQLKPILTDFAPKYSVDGQYIFMGLWAFDLLRAASPKLHVDVGGQISWLAFLTKFFPVEHVDIRDSGTRMANFKVKQGSITALPYKDESVESLSCLHVAEHIGLGRYGDEIDPDGFNKGCRELARVLAPGGKLYFAVPTGIPSVHFNAHRVLSAMDVREAFWDIGLLEYSAIDSSGSFFPDVQLDFLDKDVYGCGLYLFEKGGERK